MLRGLGKSFLSLVRPRWLSRHQRSGQPASKTATRRPVTHVVILDGTMSSLQAGEESNVGLIYRTLAAQSGADLSVFYEAGIQWRSWSRTHEVVMGRGINRQIRRAYGYLASRYRPGDRIFLFGYSRGAFAVRSLAGIIDRVGLVRADAATERNIRQAYRHYEQGGRGDAARAFARLHCHEATEIEMVGVFDTVKSLGLRLPLLWKITARHHDFHNHELSRCVKAGYQALALDESRAVYAPVMWQKDPAWSGRLEQVWFPGVHGDVGGHLGGFYPARPLANIPLVWMLDRAEAEGMTLPTDWRSTFATDPHAPSVGMWRGVGRLFLMRQKRRVGADPSERLHESVITRGGPMVDALSGRGLLSGLNPRRHLMMRKSR